ncbi:MAG: hypothetical protein P4L73_16325 [Caulobacteraceae bacterium]|nr:hypothetical protein [Caulobacteraceae bacterium]
MKSITGGLAALMVALSLASGAAASPQSDAFTKCLTEASTGKDHIVFVQWMFAALSVNSNVQAFSNVTNEQRAALTQQMADIMQRLVLADCRAEAVAAVRQDGQQVFQGSFEVFGRSAMVDLMSDPNVGKQLGALSDRLDTAKWAAFAAEAKK